MEPTVFQTVLAGVSVFVIGQFVIKLLLEPLVRFREALGEVSALFLRSQAKITNANAGEELSQEIKLASARLISLRQSIPFYGTVAFVFRLPSKASLTKGCQSLNLIANAIRDVDEDPKGPATIDSEMSQIQKKLGIIVRYGR